MNWEKYWEQDSLWSEIDFWKINSKIFADTLNKVAPPKRDSVILDVGCGSGDFELFWANRVKEIYAIDKSESLIRKCKTRCQNLSNVKVQHLKGDSTDFSFLDTKFDFIFLISAIQYFEDINSVEKMIKSLQSIAKKNGKLIIADIPIERTPFQTLTDIIYSILFAIRRGYFFVYLKSAFKVLLSPTYQAAKSKNKELKLSLKDLDNIIERLNIKAQIIWESVSVCAKRPSLLLSFDK